MFVSGPCSNATSPTESHLLTEYSKFWGGVFSGGGGGVVCFPLLECKLDKNGGFVWFKDVFPAPKRVSGTKQAFNKYYS